MCGENFTSKTKLFKHLSLFHEYENDNYKMHKTQRIALVFGWIATKVENEVNVWRKEMSLETTVQVDEIEREILKTIYSVETNTSINDVPKDEYLKFPRGYSRCGRSGQLSSFSLGVEPNTSGCGDVICISVKRIDNPVKVNEWVDNLNSILPLHIRIISRTNIPSTSVDWNAETSCTQRRYEYMIPLNLLMPKQLKFSESSYELLPKNHVPDTIMDALFPKNSIEGNQRVECFMKMKEIMKFFAIQGRSFYHNYTTGGSTVDEFASRRKIDRLFHKEIISLQYNENSKELYVIFSISGDDFLRGQIIKMLTVVIAIYYEWLPIEFLCDSFHPATCYRIPNNIPGYSLYLAECKYSKYESKFNNVVNCSDNTNVEGEENLFRLDPRRSKDPIGLKRYESFLTQLHSHIANLQMNDNTNWLNQLQINCLELKVEWEILRGLRLRSFESLDKSLLTQTPQIYSNALYLLQQADESGLWIRSSTNRQRVIDESSIGGTFSVGCFPAPFPMPKGNQLFAELMKYCFLLERVLCPNRIPSSTIAINRHAQFKPHRDSGKKCYQLFHSLCRFLVFLSYNSIVSFQSHQ